MTYQDKWAHGKLIERGYRECESRYHLIRKYCAEKFGYSQPFSVCDIGANMCYFGIRLCEDFPNCHVVAFENDHFEQRLQHLESSGAKRVMLIDRRLSLRDLATLAVIGRFDVVLALSVLHHVGGSLEQWLASLKNLGGYVIVEMAGGDSKRATERGRTGSVQGDLLGFGKSHLKESFERPILVMKGKSL